MGRERGRAVRPGPLLGHDVVVGDAIVIPATHRLGDGLLKVTAVGSQRLRGLLVQRIVRVRLLHVRFG